MSTGGENADGDGRTGYLGNQLPGSQATIIRHGTRAFAKLGYHRATVRDIASESHISPTLIYHHFDGKPGLFTACVSHAASQCGAIIRATLIESRPLDLRARLQALAATLIEWSDHHPGELDLLARVLVVGEGLEVVDVDLEVLAPLDESFFPLDAALRLAYGNQARIYLTYARASMFGVLSAWGSFDRRLGGECLLSASERAGARDLLAETLCDGVVSALERGSATENRS